MQTMQTDRVFGTAPILGPRTDELVALTEASNRLRDVHRHLSLVQRPAVPLPQFNPMPSRIDDRLSGAFTKARKSVVNPLAPNRIVSELYPLPNPPFHPFVPGLNTRHIGRVPAVTYT